MEEFWTRIYEHLMDRATGPMKFRILMQPAIAIFFATRDGLRDARNGHLPYFWSLLVDKEHRGQELHDGWKGIGKVFVIALVLDVVYQLFVQKTLYPGEMLIVAFFLAIVPYVLLRGLVTRIARK